MPAVWLAAGSLDNHPLMNFRNHLLREAGKLASSQTVRRINLWAEIVPLEARPNLTAAERAALEHCQAEMENCAQAFTRFGKYRPHQDEEPACPHCWIVRGESATLRKG